MQSLWLECAEAEAEWLSAELWEHGALGIQEEPLPLGRCRLRAFFERPDGLPEAFARFNPHVAPEPAVDWEAHARQAWQPFPVGRRLYLAPVWDESPTPTGRLRLTVHPGQALGTGAHSATQLCLEGLEQAVWEGDAVLDVGTGSGILLAGAALLGAGQLIGADIDGQALQEARRNLQSVGLAARLFLGSARVLKTHAVDVLVSNINAAVHSDAAKEYTRVARRVLILSGYPSRHAAQVAAAIGSHGWRVVDTLSRDEWICHLFLRDGTS
jgi:ribosomal protein L11 methyltransferase